MWCRSLQISLLFGTLVTSIHAAPAPECLSTYQQSPYVYLDLVSTQILATDDGGAFCSSQTQSSVPQFFAGASLALLLQSQTGSFSVTPTVQFALKNEATQATIIVNSNPTNCIVGSSQIFTVQTPVSLAAGSYSLSAVDSSQAYCALFNIKLVITQPGIVSGNGADGGSSPSPNGSILFADGESTSPSVSMSGCALNPHAPNKNILILSLLFSLMILFARRFAR